MNVTVARSATNTLTKNCVEAKSQRECTAAYETPGTHLLDIVRHHPILDRSVVPSSIAPRLAACDPPSESSQCEARHEDRPHLALPVVVCGIGMTGKLFFELTRTLDVSRSGCRLHLRTQPQPDSPLAVRLIRRGEDMREESIQVLFRVVWLQETREGWTIGAASLGET